MMCKLIIHKNFLFSLRFGIHLHKRFSILDIVKIRVSDISEKCEYQLEKGHQLLSLSDLNSGCLCTHQHSQYLSYSSDYARLPSSNCTINSISIMPLAIVDINPKDSIPSPTNHMHTCYLFIF